MSEPIDVPLIEPKFLAELAEKALQEAKKLENPYLRGLLARFGHIALELKAALERETRR